MSVISILGTPGNSNSIKRDTPNDSPTLHRNPNTRKSAQGGDENEIMNLLLEVFGRKSNMNKLLK